MDRWKAEQGRGREKRKIRREKIRRERVRRQKIQLREKVGKSRNTVFFQWFVAPEGREVGSLKRRVRSQLATGAMKNCPPLWHEAHFQVKMCKKHQGFGSLLEVAMSKKCTPLWREAHFEVKMYKTLGVRTTFGSCDVEKVHAVVARSTFRSQNVQSTPCSDHFWRFRCRKSVRGCGGKHISKSKCTKHTMLGPLLEVQMSKKCTPLWREAHFEVKMLKALGVWTTFGGSDVSSLRFTTIDGITLHYTPLHYTTLHNTTTTTTQLHSTTPNYTTLHYTPLRYITLHYTTFHYTWLHYTTLHYTTLHYTTTPTAQLHSTTQHYTTLHYLPLHLTTLHYITLHSTTLQLQLHNYTTTLHYTKLHYTTLH